MKGEKFKNKLKHKIYDKRCRHIYRNAIIEWMITEKMERKTVEIKGKLGEKSQKMVVINNINIREKQSIIVSLNLLNN